MTATTLRPKNIIPQLNSADKAIREAEKMIDNIVGILDLDPVSGQNPNGSSTLAIDLYQLQQNIEAAKARLASIQSYQGYNSVTYNPTKRRR